MPSTVHVTHLWPPLPGSSEGLCSCSCRCGLARCRGRRSCRWVCSRCVRGGLCSTAFRPASLRRGPEGGYKQDGSAARPAQAPGRQANPMPLIIPAPVAGLWLGGTPQRAALQGGHLLEGRPSAGWPQVPQRAVARMAAGIPPAGRPVLPGACRRTPCAWQSLCDAPLSQGLRCPSRRCSLMLWAMPGRRLLTAVPPPLQPRRPSSRVQTAGASASNDLHTQAYDKILDQFIMQPAEC